MPGFEPQAKSQSGARGFNPAIAAALAQAQNQAPDSIHAMVKPGEFVLPPDTVHAMGGAQVLHGVVNATHTPARGFAPQARPEEPRQFFANGGPVEDESPKRPNSFGDAAAAAQDAGVTQVGGLANDGGASANRIAQVPAPIGTQPNRTPAPAPLGEPGATTAERGFAPPGIAAQPAAGDSAGAGAGAGRGFVNPASAAPRERGIVGFKPGTPEAIKVVDGTTPPRPAPAAAAPFDFDTFQPQSGEGAFRNEQTGEVTRLQDGPAPRGFRTWKEPSVVPRTDAPPAPRQDVRTSVLNPNGGVFAAVTDFANQKAQAMEAIAANKGMRNDRRDDLNELRTNADIAATAGRLNLEGQRQTGEASRTRMQQALVDIRERRTAQHQASQEDIARQRLALDTARLGRDGVPSGYRPKADGTLEAIPGGPADPATQAGKKPLNDTQAKALQFGARMQQSGQNLDALASDGATQPGYIKRMADTVGAGALANWTQNPQQQQVEQSQRDFVNAVLRRESGAAISNSEFDNARQQYFPQIGDSAKVIEQKRRNRELATRGVLAEVPDSEKRVQQVTAAGQPTQQPQRAASRTGTINGRKVVQYSDGSISYAD